MVNLKKVGLGTNGIKQRVQSKPSQTVTKEMIHYQTVGRTPRKIGIPKVNLMIFRI